MYPSSILMIVWHEKAAAGGHSMICGALPINAPMTPTRLAGDQSRMSNQLGDRFQHTRHPDKNRNWMDGLRTQEDNSFVHVCFNVVKSSVCFQATRCLTAFWALRSHVQSSSVSFEQTHVADKRPLAHNTEASNSLNIRAISQNSDNCTGEYLIHFMFTRQEKGHDCFTFFFFFFGNNSSVYGISFILGKGAYYDELLVLYINVRATPLIDFCIQCIVEKLK